MSLSVPLPRRTSPGLRTTTFCSLPTRYRTLSLAKSRLPAFLAHHRSIPEVPATRSRSLEISDNMHHHRRPPTPAAYSTFIFPKTSCGVTPATNPPHNCSFRKPTLALRNNSLAALPPQYENARSSPSSYLCVLSVFSAQYRPQRSRNSYHLPKPASLG